MKRLICGTFFLLLFELVIAQNPNSWARVADFGGIARGAGVSFSIDSFGYYGLGTYTSDTTIGLQYASDFWQYNPYANTWIQKASFPGIPRENAISFVIGSKAYIGLGDNNTSQGLNDFWEYDPSTDTWTQKANFGGGYRDLAMGFSIGSKGYAGSGYSDTSIGSKVKNDLWQYDPATDSWMQLGDFPVAGRVEGALFNIGNYEYVGIGFTYSTQVITNDIWQYNPNFDSWTALTNFPGDTISGACFRFSILDKGYLEVYYDSIPNDYSSASHSMYFWEYSPTSDTWEKKDSFSGGMRQGSGAFSITNKGYVVSGSPYYVSNCVKDAWMYTPDSIATGIQTLDEDAMTIYPDPATDKIYIRGLPTSATLTITDITGRICATPLGSDIDVSALPSGVYYLRIQDSKATLTRKFIKE